MLKKIKHLLMVERGDRFEPLKYANGDYIYIKKQMHIWRVGKH